jgi:hypothetical protein
VVHLFPDEWSQYDPAPVPEESPYSPQDCNKILGVYLFSAPSLFSLSGGGLLFDSSRLSPIGQKMQSIFPVVARGFDQFV